VKWTENTPENAPPIGSQLLAIKKRGPYSTDIKPAWHQTIYPVIVQRVGTICGNDRPDRDKVCWYGHNYQSASDPESDSHYLLLTDLPEIPPLPEPTAEDIAKHEEWQRSSREASARFTKALMKAYSDKHVVELLKK